MLKRCHRWQETRREEYPPCIKSKRLVQFRSDKAGQYCWNNVQFSVTTLYKSVQGTRTDGMNMISYDMNTKLWILAPVGTSLSKYSNLTLTVSSRLIWLSGHGQSKWSACSYVLSLDGDLWIYMDFACFWHPLNIYLNVHNMFNFTFCNSWAWFSTQIHK